MSHHLRIALMTLLTTALLALTFASPALAKRRGGPPVMDADGPSESEVAIRTLKRTIAAEELVLALDLTPEQKTELAALVDEVVQEREAKRAQREADAPQLQELLEDYLAELRSSGAASDKTVEALSAFRQSHRPDKEAMRGKHEGTRDAMKSILEPDQLEALRDFRPMQAAGPSDEEIEAMQAERRERRAEKIEREHDRGPSPEEMDEMHREGKDRKRVHRTVKEVLFTAEMLEVLSR
jgi:hypothetical protein